MKSTYVDELMTKLPGALAAALPSVPMAEKEHFFVALNACAPDTLGRFRADLRIIHMEACMNIAARSIPDKPTFLLITEDYKFFRTFVRSGVVEGLLCQNTLAILGISEWVVVKLVGEGHAVESSVR